MADGRIIIDATMNTDDIDRQVASVNQKLGRIGETVPQATGKFTDEMGNRYDSLGRRIREVYKGTSVEAQRMSGEMRSAFAKQRVSMGGLRDDMIEVQYGYFKMAQGSKDYQGTNEQFMSGIEDMGKKHKKINDNMMASNDMQKMNFYKSVGSMLARSTQASKISDNFDRMGNPLYRVNNGLLGVADGMNKIAMRGQPAALALKMLGPSANMKQLRDMTGMITQGIMRMTMVAAVAAIGAGLFYKALHDGAMESNAAYAEAFNGMLASVKKAFEPMIDVFAMVMIPVYKFIKLIADLIVKFNEANPTIAKLVAGFLLLIPALILILSPLAIGIGLIAGFQAAWGAVFMLIGPLITGLAAMSGTVLLVAAGIVALVAVGILLYKNWDVIKAKAIELWATVKSYFITGVTAVRNAVVTGYNAMISWFAGFWARLKASFSAGINGISNFARTAFTAIVTFIKWYWTTLISFYVGLWNGIRNGAVSAWNGIATFFTSVSNRIVNGAKAIWNGIRSFFSSLWSGIRGVFTSALSAISLVVSSKFGYVITAIRSNMQQARNIISNVWNIIKNIFLGAVLMILNLVTGDFGKMRSQLAQIMGNIRSSMSSIWNSIKTMISTTVKTLQRLVIQYFNGMRDGMINVANRARQAVINSFNALRTGAVNAVNAMKTGAINAFNALRTGAINSVNALRQGVINGFNSARTGAVNAVNALRSGAINAFNALRSGAISAVNSIRSGVVNGFNAARSATVASVNSMKASAVSAFNSMVSAITGAMSRVRNAISSGWNSAISFLRGIDLSGIGRNIIEGLIRGISSMIGSVSKVISGIADKIKSGITKALSIKSPSRWMRDKVGAMIPAGVAVGVEGNLSPLDKAVKKMSGKLKVGAEATIAKTGFGASQPQTINRGVTQNVTINSPKALNPSEVARQNKRVAQQLAMNMGW